MGGNHIAGAYLFLEHSKVIRRAAMVTGTLLVRGIIFNPIGYASLQRAQGGTFEIRHCVPPSNT